MIWPGMLFNLCVGLLLAGYLLRRVRRFERRADELLARMDREHDERIARYHRFRDECLRDYDTARDEIRESMRSQVDGALSKTNTRYKPSNSRVSVGTANLTLGAVRLSATGTVSPPTAERLPTDVELSHLPRWAQVAFAARVARRVSDLWFAIAGSSVDVREDIWQSIRHAERISTNPKLAVTGTISIGGQVVLDYESDDPRYSGANAAEALSHVSRNALWACNAAKDRAVQHTLSHTAAAVQNAIVATEFLAPTALEDVAIAIHNDYSALKILNESVKWTDDTPVPSSVFGPLWRTGSPHNWPTAGEPITEVTIAFDVPDDMTTAAAVEFAKELSAILCALDLAGGGHGVAIEPPLEITAPVSATVRA
jgi:hypothetical protein